MWTLLLAYGAGLATLPILTLGLVIYGILAPYTQKFPTFDMAEAMRGRDRKLARRA